MLASIGSALLLLPASPSTVLISALSMGAPLISLAPAQAQSEEAVAKVAQAITVRIEGATQGSGVLVKRVGNRYTVLTAWHVVSGQNPGEELSVYTSDGRQHPVEAGSIRRVGDIDLGELTFSSTIDYQLAKSGNTSDLRIGAPVYVSGYPSSTSAIPSRIFRFLRGAIINNASERLPGGYQLLYDNSTLPGMSGGSVLNINGHLVGLHGQGETDAKLTEVFGVAVKTNTNQGIPISSYTNWVGRSDRSQPSDISAGIIQRESTVGEGFKRTDLSNSSNSITGFATPKQMALYTRIGAVNTCISRAAGLSFEQAVGVAGETIAQLILGQHKGLIQEVGSKALTIEELRRGAINSSVLGAAEFCPKEVPADVMRKVNEAIKRQGAGGSASLHSPIPTGSAHFHSSNSLSKIKPDEPIAIEGLSSDNSYVLPRQFRSLPSWEIAVTTSVAGGESDSASMGILHEPVIAFPIYPRSTSDSTHMFGDSSQSHVVALAATPIEMGLYTRIGTVNFCILRAAGIDFEKSVGIAGETIAQLLLFKHKGEIQQVGSKALTIKELRRGAFNSAVIGGAEICPKEVPADVMKKVQDAIRKQSAT